MKKFLLLETSIIIVILIAGWIFGARTIFDFSQALLWGGLVVMGAGVISLVGQWGSRTDATYLVARTVADQNGINRARQSFEDIRASFSFLFLTLILGGIPIIIGLVIDWLLS